MRIISNKLLSGDGRFPAVFVKTLVLVDLATFHHEVDVE
jgi:hypothetical protein